MKQKHLDGSSSGHVKFITLNCNRELVDIASSIISDVLENSLRERGRAILAIPGGETPVPIYRALSNRKLDWSHVTLIPTDDRLVGTEKPLNNFGLIRAFFGETGASIIPLCDEQGGDPKVAGYAADLRLRGLTWPLDLVWLGMGTDGHTASILPGPNFEAALTETVRALGVLPVPLPPNAPFGRVTLTREALTDARALLLTITGRKKLLIAEQAIKQGAMSATAIGRVLADYGGPVTILWSE